MAVDSTDPTTGRPIFTDAGAPQTGADLTSVGSYAAEVGNRVVKANLAALEAYPYKRKGLAGVALDTGAQYVHTGTGWVISGGPNGGQFASAAGLTYVNVGTGVTVTFPAGVFPTIPAVTVTPYNSGAVIVPHVTNLTKDSFFLRLYTLAGATTTANASWHAVHKSVAGVS